MLGHKLPLASRSMLLWIGKASLTLFRSALQPLDLSPCDMSDIGNIVCKKQICLSTETSVRDQKAPQMPGLSGENCCPSNCSFSSIFAAALHQVFCVSLLILRR